MYGFAVVAPTTRRKSTVLVGDRHIKKKCEEQAWRLSKTEYNSGSRKITISYQVRQNTSVIQYYGDLVEHFKRSVNGGFGKMANKLLQVCALVCPLDPPQHRSSAVSSAASDFLI